MRQLGIDWSGPLTGWHRDATWRSQCRYQSRWGPTRYRCPRVALFGLCIEHILERCRWDRKWGPVSARLDLSNLNRPQIHLDHDQHPPQYISFDYGNGNSDPVLSVAFERRS